MKSPQRSLLALPILLAACGGSGGSHTDMVDVAGDMATASDLATAAPPQGLDLPTAQGTVHGRVAGGTRVFYNLPFAAPPVGDRRFKPPAAPAAWSGTRDATAVGNVCPQFPLLSTTLSGDEDCLTLNVWTPDAPSKRYPVMVWIHGGGFVLGSGTDPTYDGAKLSAAGPVVVVTINYRLGALGFLAHPALDAEDGAFPSSGNYGLLDQQAALRWVQANIAAFAGDPQNVTIFGESAGGISVCDQLVSPGAAGLFHRAIMESGPCTFGTADKATWQAQGASLATALGCSSGDAQAVRGCLRAKTAAQVLAALPGKANLVFGAGVSWGPDVDGVVLPESPLARFKAGKQSSVPLVVGANKDEGTLFLALPGVTINDEADLRVALGSLMPSAGVDAVLAHYPVASVASAKDDASKILGDLFVCDARRVARFHAAATHPTFQYHFTRAFEWQVFPNLGAFHSAEIPFIFGNPYISNGVSTAELPLSTAMQGYWTRHARTGDPNGNPAPPWPAYQASTDQHLQLDLAVAVGANLRKADCDFWDGLLP